MSLKSKELNKFITKNCKNLQSTQLFLAALLVRRLKQKQEASTQNKEFLCCRSCLGSEELVSIFEQGSDYKLAEEFTLVTGLEIQKDDGLPQSICSRCLKKIKDNITFRDECKKTAKKLTKWGFIRNKTETEVTIKTENEFNNMDNWDELGVNYAENNVIDNYDYEDMNIEPDFEFKKPVLKSGRKVVKKKKLMPPYRCHICKKCMANPSSLKTHLNWHTGHSSYICETCGKRCLNRTAFLQHMKGKHGLQRTDKCSYCDYMALNREQLKIHERRHTGEQPYICAHCGAGFHRRANLVQHLPIHLAAKTVQCDLCPSTFKSAKFLATHKSRAHTNKNFSYICHICQTVYKKSFNVRKHMLKMHGIPREQQGDILRIRIRSFDTIYNAPVMNQ